MNKPDIRRIVISLLIVLLVSSFALASSPQGTFEKTFQVTGPVDLDVETHSGDIIVRSGDSTFR